MLELKILLDNNTIIDKYFYGEPGVSYLIKEGNKKILFDVGYSDAFLKNAFKFNESLKDIDFLAFSHGHVDHTWGINSLISMFSECAAEGIPYKKPLCIGHPRVFEYKVYDDGLDIGFLVTEDAMKRHFSLKLSKEPIWITENLVFLGEIPRENDFESKFPIGKVFSNGVYEDDYVIDDTAIAYKSSKGLVIISGCSHAGICNIVEYAKKVTGINKVFDIIGGFHLMEPSKKVIENTVDYLASQNLEKIHPCHCTDLLSKIEISKKIPIGEVGSGMIFNYE